MKDTLKALLLASMMTFTLNASGQTSHMLEEEKLQQ